MMLSGGSKATSEMPMESLHGRISGYANSPVMARNSGRKIIVMNNTSEIQVRRDQKMLSKKIDPYCEDQKMLMAARGTENVLLKNVECEILYLVDSPGCRNDEASGLYLIHFFDIQRYIRNMPVSYTHLDVYKRQVIMQSIRRLQ